jgi:predicted thioesterase
MDDGPRIGDSAELSLTVTPMHTADAIGNPGVPVYATPQVVALMESAGHAVLRPHLPPGGGSVGTMVEMRHLAATPVGMRVRARATVLARDGRRALFAVEAWDEREKIAEGRQERAVVPDLARFLERVARKGRA